ncbi:MAG: histidinol-phosphatase [Treponema sp.]|nr:histidinol-phosphatase [Treponema sp.]
MKKIANYHTHTLLCKHATGMPSDYVEQAQKEGCLELGISDHCPYPESFDDTWPHVRMSVEQVDQYRAMVNEAKQKAAFPVHMGFECEYDARYKSWYGDELKGKYKAEYLVLGSHWVTDGTSHVYCPDITDSSLLNRYIDQTIAGMETGLFAFLAHPDLFMKGWKEWDAQAKSCLSALLDAAKGLDMPIEVNGLGISRTPNNTSRGMRYQYPYVEFWEMVAQTNVRVICNSDAHAPEDVIMNAWKARDFAGRFGITPIERLTAFNTSITIKL